jgi:hypothetical protein
MTSGRNYGRGSRTAQAWVRRHVVGLALFVAGFLISPLAAAQAPMCDASGATVMAPMPAPPSDDGEITLIACPEQTDLGAKIHPGGRAPLQEKQLQSFHDDLGLMPIGPVSPPSSTRGTIIDLEAAQRSAPLGYRSQVFRPPRCC